MNCEWNSHFSVTDDSSAAIQQLQHYMCKTKILYEILLDLMRENHSLEATCLEPIHLRKFKSASQYVYNAKWLVYHNLLDCATKSLMWHIYAWKLGYCCV